MAKRDRSELAGAGIAAAIGLMKALSHRRAVAESRIHADVVNQTDPKSAYNSVVDYAERAFRAVRPSYGGAWVTPDRMANVQTAVDRFAERYGGWAGQMVGPAMRAAKPTR